MKRLKYYVPYIVAAIVSFFFCPVLCFLSGVDCYEFTWVDLAVSAVTCVMVFSLRGEDGVIVLIRDTFKENFGRKEREDDNIRLDSD